MGGGTTPSQCSLPLWGIPLEFHMNNQSGLAWVIWQIRADLWVYSGRHGHSHPFVQKPVYRKLWFSSPGTRELDISHYSDILKPSKIKVLGKQQALPNKYHSVDA